MRVLITGGVGLIGRATAHRLQANGWDVQLIDIVPEAKVNDSHYTQCDIMDFDSLQAQVRGCDVVVHLAALPNPWAGETQDVFRINTSGTFNVFEAAAQAGIRRVVQASSFNAIGCGWNLGDFVPHYLALDEDHPSVTTDSYAFSKFMVEDIGRYYWRRDGISSTSLRFPGVFPPEHFKSDNFNNSRNAMVAFLDEFLTLPEDERQRQLEEVRARTIEYRAQRQMEFPNTTAPKIDLGTINEYLWRANTFDRYYLWSIVDVRDVAQSIEKSLTADFEGSHPLFINDHHNSLGYDSHVLAELFYPNPYVWKHPVTGSEALVSIERARQLIGFEPEHSVLGTAAT